MGMQGLRIISWCDKQPAGHAKVDDEVAVSLLELQEDPLATPFDSFNGFAKYFRIPCGIPARAEAMPAQSYAIELAANEFGS